MMASFFSLVWSFRTLHLVHVASHLTAVPIFFHIIVMMTGTIMTMMRDVKDCFSYVVTHTFFDKFPRSTTVRTTFELLDKRGSVEKQIDTYNINIY